MEKLARRQSLILPSEEPAKRYEYGNETVLADNVIGLQDVQPEQQHRDEIMGRLATRVQSLSI